MDQVKEFANYCICLNLSMMNCQSSPKQNDVNGISGQFSLQVHCAFQHDQQLSSAQPNVACYHLLLS